MKEGGKPLRGRELNQPSGGSGMVCGWPLSSRLPPRVTPSVVEPDALAPPQGGLRRVGATLLALVLEQRQRVDGRAVDADLEVDVRPETEAGVARLGD